MLREERGDCEDARRHYDRYALCGNDCQLWDVAMSTEQVVFDVEQVCNLRLIHWLRRQVRVPLGV